MKRNVLFIDDEKMVLEALRRSMRGKPDSWDLHFVDTIEDFWKIIDRQKFDVVITDMHMPGTSGTDLVRSLREKQPETVRIILSGFKDNEEVVHSDGVHRFLTKPIMVNSLIKHINATLEVEIDEARRAILHGTSSIVASTDYLERLHALVDQTGVQISELAALVRSDPGMSAKILQLGNSNFFAGHRHGLDIEESLLAIGTESLRSLLSGNALWSFATDDPRDTVVKNAINHAGDIATRCASSIQHSSQNQATVQMAATLHVAGALLSLPQTNAANVGDFVCDKHDVELAAALMQLWGIPVSVVQELHRIASIGCNEWASALT